MLLLWNSEIWSPQQILILQLWTLVICPPSGNYFSPQSLRHRSCWFHTMFSLRGLCSETDGTHIHIFNGNHFLLVILHINKIKTNTLKSTCDIVCISFPGQIPPKPINLFPCHSLCSFLFCWFILCVEVRVDWFFFPPKDSWLCRNVWPPRFFAELWTWHGSWPCYQLLLLFTLNPTYWAQDINSCPDRWPAWHRVPEAGQCKSLQDLLTKLELAGVRKREIALIQHSTVYESCFTYLFFPIEPPKNPLIDVLFLPLYKWRKWGLRKVNHLFAKEEIESGLKILVLFLHGFYFSLRGSVSSVARWCPRVN